MGPLAYLLVLGCVLLETTEQMFYRLAGRNNARYFAYVAPAVAAHVTRTALWYLLLKTTPLGVALPLMGANYLTIALASRVLFKEKVNARRWLATAIILAGFALVTSHGYET